MKKILCVLLSVLLLFSFVACGTTEEIVSDDTAITTTVDKVQGGQEETPDDDEGNTETTVAVDDETDGTSKTKKTRKTTTTRGVQTTTTGAPTNFGSGYVNALPRDLQQAGQMRYLGRTYSSYDGGCFMTYGNTGFVITGTLEGYVSMSLSVDKNACAINVVIDGDVANKQTHWVKAGSTSLTLVSDLKKGEHTIEVTKGTAHHAGSLNISELRYNGTLKTPASKLQIEFIGDSVTVGEGMYGAASGDVGLAMSYNTFDGYAAQVARNLGAEVSTIAACGAKVPGMTDAFLDSMWDFGANPKKIVVINMGTNDLGWSHISLSSVESTLRPDCTSLIRSVRQKYGKDTYIIWAYGMMFDKDKNFFKSVVGNYAADNNDNRVLFCDLSAAKDNSGNASHPSTQGNDKAATILTQFIKDNCK